MLGDHAPSLTESTPPTIPKALLNRTDMAWQKLLSGSGPVATTQYAILTRDGLSTNRLGKYHGLGGTSLVGTARGQENQVTSARAVDSCAMLIIANRKDGYPTRN
jgi:hypothetical protein